jgi:uroporphyrinogen-III synthase
VNLKLFISRRISDDSPLLQLEDVDIYAESLIEIHLQKEDVNLDAFEWIFFSSGGGVKWAIENKLNLTSKKIAAIGSATASKLLDYEISVDFVGNDADSIEAISEKFGNHVGDEKVLFPISSKSKKTILNKFSGNFETTIAYITELSPILLDEEMDIYVFTSPSNFESFFQANSIKDSKLVVAIGETTKSEIEKYLNIPIFTPEEKTENAIYELLKTTIPTHFT